MSISNHFDFLASKFLNKVSNLFQHGATDGEKKFTFAELKNLYDVLQRNPVVNESNKALVVETVRSIAEFMIWGDQNEPRIFDFFLENNIMVYLQKMLQQPANRSGEVAKQVLQTLGIIIQNIRSETGIFFLFSNNHVNNIVAIRFDFEDEEVLGYYISFLKAISLKLTPNTVQFFMVDPTSEQQGNDGLAFPLYTEAVKFAHHKEGMVRAGVRTLTLNVYSVRDSYIQAFVTTPPATAYFSDVTKYMAEQFKILDARMAAAQGFAQQLLASLDSQIAEVEDMLSYCSDVLNTGHPFVAHLVSKQLWTHLVGPFMLAPLLAASDADMAKAGPQLIKPHTALYILERLFHLINYRPLLHNVAVALLAPPQDASSSGSQSLVGSLQPWAVGPQAGGVPSCRLALAMALRSPEPYVAPAALRMLLALVKCSSMDAAVMTALNVLPATRINEWAHAIPSTACGLCDLPGQLQAQRLTSPPPDSTTSVSPSSQLEFAYYMVWTDASHPLSQPAHPEPHLGINGTHISGSQQAMTASSSSSQLDGPTPLLNSITPVNAGTPKGQPGTPRAPVLPHPLAEVSDQPSNVDIVPLISFDDDDDVPASKTPVLAACSSREAADAAVTRALGAAAAELEDMQARTEQKPSSSLDATIDELVHNMVEVAIWEATKDLSRVNGPELVELLPGLSSTAASPAGASTQQAAESVSPEPPEPVPEPPAVPCGVHLDACYELQGSWLTDALFDILRAPHLPLHSLWHVAYLLQQWLYRPHPALSGAAASSTPTKPAGGWVCSVSTEQRQQLWAALTAAGAAALQELNGMWSEAFFSLLCQEWLIAAEGIHTPLLRTTSELLMVGPHLYPTEAAPPQAQRAHHLAMGVSAVSALKMVHGVGRLVSLLQVAEVLREGKVSRTPPVPPAPKEDHLRQDITEGQHVEMSAATAIPCQVSFQAGQERRVYFSVKGASLEHISALEQDPTVLLRTPSASTPASPESPDGGTGYGGEGGGGAGPRPDLLHSSPGIVLAEPAPTRLHAGIVLATAPLMGSQPIIDPNVSRWLHVHVRPSVRGLLRLVRTAAGKKGGIITAVKSLADGHWVLAFQDADRVRNAVALVQDQSTRLQRVHRDLAGMVIESMVSLVL